RKFNKPEIRAEFPAYLPREITWVHRPTATADPGARSKLHITEGLRVCSFDGVPDTHTKLMREHDKLIHQRNIRMPEGVLQQLCQFGFFRCRNCNGLLHELLVDFADFLKRGFVNS